MKTEFPAEASESRMRVTLRDQNSGIGHKRGDQEEWTGIDAFQKILGRLNGKSEETIAKDQNARSSHRHRVYMEQKYGGVNFVRGGLLFSDKTEPAEDEARNGDLNPAVEIGSRSKLPSVAESEPAPAKSVTRDKSQKKGRKEKVKKRKAADDDPGSDKASKKKRRKLQNSTGGTDIDTFSSSNDQNQSHSLEKKPKKRKCKSKSISAVEGKAAKKNTEDEKSEKAEKNKAPSHGGKSKTGKRKDKSAKASFFGSEDAGDPSSASESRQPPAALYPSASGAMSYPPVNARRLHRARFIAQKRAAVLDSTALNQVFTSQPTGVIRDESSY